MFVVSFVVVSFVVVIGLFMINSYFSKQLIRAIDEKNYEKIETLSQCQLCNINALPTPIPVLGALVEQSAMTPLQTACYNNDTRAVQILLQYGADANYTPPYNLCNIPPIHFAATNGNVEIMELLLDSNADISSVYQGKDVWESLVVGAIRSESIDQLDCGVNLLRSRGVIPKKGLFVTSALYGKTAFSMYLVNEGLVSVDETDENGRNALHSCLISGYVRPTEEFVLFLIELGVDTSHKDKYGKTAYDYAVEKGYTDLAEILR